MVVCVPVSTYFNVINKNIQKSINIQKLKFTFYIGLALVIIVAMWLCPSYHVDSSV